MLNFRRHELLFGKRESGTTLVELLVVLAIISTLAVVALPLAENGIQRQKESQLRETLRTVRGAIDAFHADWQSGEIAGDDEAVSEFGYPVSLTVLVEGLTGTGPEGAHLRYLRRVPDNPFAGRGGGIAENWVLLGYEDTPEAEKWNGKDVYDLKANTNKSALDGTKVSDW